jgi:hypothetical protein
MVVARKSRKQTAQRTFDFSGTLVVKPESDRLAAWIVIKVKAPLEYWSDQCQSSLADFGAGASRLRIVSVGLVVSKRSFRSERA